MTCLFERTAYEKSHAVIETLHPESASLIDVVKGEAAVE